MRARDRIVAAGVTVFGRYGFRQASMELVAEAVGVTRQALYRHFSSKEALLSAVVETLHEEAFAAARHAVATTKASKLSERLAAALDARFAYILDRLASSPHASELLQEQDRHSGQISAEYRDRFVEYLGEVIDEGLTPDEGLVPGTSSRDLARYIFLAARALKSSIPPPPTAMFRPDLHRLVSIMVAGAISRGER